MAQPPCRCLEGRSLFCPHCLLIIYQQPQLLVKSHVRPVVDECKRFAAFTHATAARGRQPHLCRPPTLQRKRAGVGARTTHWVGTAVQIRPSLEVCCFVDGFLMILAQRQAHCTALPGRWEKLMSSCDVPGGEFIFFSVSFDIKIKFYTSASNLNYAVARHRPRPEMKRGTAEIQTATTAIGLLASCCFLRCFHSWLPSLSWPDFRHTCICTQSNTVGGDFLRVGLQTANECIRRRK